MKATEELILLTARACLGLIFFLSALGKVRNLRSFIRGTVEYRVLPESIARAFALVLPWIEFAIALGFISGFATRLAGAVAVVVLTSFIVAVAINLQEGRQIKCNCFGLASTPTISLGTIVRNILLLILAGTVVYLAQPGLGRVPQAFSWSSIDSVLLPVDDLALVFVLVSSCLVVINLLEWTVHGQSRASRLLHRPPE